MKVIVKSNFIIDKVLSKQALKENTEYRFLNYCIFNKVDDGELIYNNFTKEIVLIENEDDLNDPYLIEHWFKVPVNNDDQKLVLQIRNIVSMLSKQKKGLTNYTILTTTECNARCFYCFEKGKFQERMSNETALNTAEYIKKTADKSTSLNWFGGEPLFNMEVIDTICKNIGDIEYTSRMTSNGYLFDEEVIKKAVDLWHLTNVQITLDGTEKVYNAHKAYIYENVPSPFYRVINNIELLLKAGIEVNIRLNIDRSNYADILVLLDFLAEKFSKYDKCDVYACLIYQCCNDPVAEEKLKEVKEKVERLHLRKHRILIGSTIKYHQCQADSEKSMLITPGGKLSRCEHCYDFDTCGDVVNGVTDKAAYDAWKIYTPYEEKCSTCVHFPDCIRIKNCELFTYTDGLCPQSKRDRILRDTKSLLVLTYQELKNSQQNSIK